MAPIKKQGDGAERRVALVTGANSGLGYETCRVLARDGLTVILGCRSVDKGDEACRTIRSETPHADVRVMRIDTSSLHSVVSFHATFAASGLPLHVLVCNAGIMMGPRRTSADGFELQLATNYLGHWLLVRSLLPILKASGTSTRRARVVSVSSIAAHFGGFAWGDMMRERPPYSSYASYCASKLAQVVHARELARRLEREGCHTVAINSIEPGVVNTPLADGITDNESMANNLKRGITVEEGARTQIHVATSPTVEGVSGRHFARSRTMSAATFLFALRSFGQGKQLWSWTEALADDALAKAPPPSVLAHKAAPPTANEAATPPTPTMPLLGVREAAKAGDVAALQAAVELRRSLGTLSLEAIQDCDARSEGPASCAGECSALTWAAYNGHLECVTLLWQTCVALAPVGKVRAARDRTINSRWHHTPCRCA